MLLEYYEKLLQLKCFSLDDAAKIFGDERKPRNSKTIYAGNFLTEAPYGTGSGCARLRPRNVP